MSLGLAPLSNANTEDETFLGSSIDLLTGRFGNPAKNRSLFNFKKKFQPTWESRYLVYTTSLVLPQLGLALFEAHQPDTSWLAVLRQSVQDWLAKRAERQSAPRPEISLAGATTHPGTGKLVL